MTADPNSCSEFHRIEGLSRRSLLKSMTAVGAGMTATSMFGEAFLQASYAVGSVDRILVVVSLRGGIDGLGLVVPHGDPGYYAARPTLALPKGSLLHADAMFGLHPDLAPLSWMWQNGEMAAAHAVGMATPTRSHFVAMERVEEADPGGTLRSGWVNRTIGLGAGITPLHGMQIGEAYPPTALRGPAPTVATAEIDNLLLPGLTGPSNWPPRRRRQLEMSWSDPSPFSAAGRSAIKVSDNAAAVASSPQPTVTYPRDVFGKDLGAALADSARLIKADVGVEMLTIDHGSWDMHSSYGNPAIGRMHDMVGGLARALDAFLRDLGDLRSKVTVVTISEFGRRVAENGNGGLDHGWGNAMLALGAGVRGGQYYGRWPGLGVGSTADGDLQVTTDYRNVLGEVITRTFPSRSLATIFPGLTYSPLGLTQPV